MVAVGPVEVMMPHVPGDVVVIGVAMSITGVMDIYRCSADVNAATIRPGVMTSAPTAIAADVNIYVRTASAGIMAGDLALSTAV